jgi:hypothetical protein
MTLPRLVDSRVLQQELGVKRSAAERIMAQCERVQIPGLRKWFVRERDVQDLLSTKERT